MPRTMQVVRGNLAAAPDYWQESRGADGEARPSFLSAVVFEDRPRIRRDDGSWQDNPAGPLRTTVKFWGASADILHAQRFRQGDSIVATGRIGEPDAYISERDGRAHARQVLLGDSMQIDAIAMARRSAAAQRRDRDSDRSSQDDAAMDETRVPAATVGSADVDPWAADASRGASMGR